MKDIEKIIDIKVDLNYPDLSELHSNMKYCKNCSRLLNDFAGYISELTAIIQYVYQAQILKDEFPNISKTLMDIAEVEMHHYMLIGEAIFKLGGSPKVVDWKGRPWSGSFPNYTSDIIEMIKNDISTEEQAIEQYKYHQMVMSNDILKDLFNRIISDEEKHIYVFKEILNHIEQSK